MSAFDTMASDTCPQSFYTISVTSGDALACQSTTGFTMAGATVTMPTDEALVAICATTTCKRLFKAMNDAIPTECQAVGVPIRATVLNKLTTACKLSSPTPTTTAPRVTSRPASEAPAETSSPVVRTAAPVTASPRTSTPTPTVDTSSVDETPAPWSAPTSTRETPPYFSPATPTPTSGSANQGNGTTTIAVVVVCIAVVAVVIFFVMKRKRRHNEDQGPRVQSTKDDDAYASLSDLETAEVTQTRSTTFPEAHVLAHCRIPYKRLQFGPIISHGGFGEVVRGKYNGQAVAIKRLLPLRRKDPQSLRVFVEEIQLTATLKHECIVQFIGAAWEEPSSLCLVSEFMVGGDLRALLVEYEKNGHANGHDDTKLRIAIHVAHAMTYLHSLDPPVVHRDLKSKNVLLTASLDAKLIDFGVSREQQDETMTAGIGTSLWMAPEVMLGKRYDGKADVFSFGVILSELDTHELPYNHARETGTGERMTSMVLLNLISKGRLLPRFTDAAHPAIVKLARDCLQLDPTLRPTATEVVNRIDACLQHDWALTDQTRTALDRAIVTVETQATTRATPPTGFDSAQIMLDTKASTRAPSS